MGRDDRNRSDTPSTQDDSDIGADSEEGIGSTRNRSKCHAYVPSKAGLYNSMIRNVPERYRHQSPKRDIDHRDLSGTLTKMDPAGGREKGGGASHTCLYG